MEGQNHKFPTPNTADSRKREASASRFLLFDPLNKARFPCPRQCAVSTNTMLESPLRACSSTASASFWKELWEEVAPVSASKP